MIYHKYLTSVFIYYPGGCCHMCHHIFPKKCIFIIPDPVKNQHLIRFFLFIKRSVFFIRSVSSSQVIISISPILYTSPCYCSSGHTKCAFPASRPSIRIFCPVQKRLVTVIKYASLPLPQLSSNASGGLFHNLIPQNFILHNRFIQFCQNTSKIKTVACCTIFCDTESNVLCVRKDPAFACYIFRKF